MASDLREVAKEIKKIIYFESFCINLLDESIILTNFDTDGYGERPRYVCINAA